MKTFLQHLEEADAFGSRWVPPMVSNPTTSVATPVVAPITPPSNSSGMTRDQYEQKVKSGEIIPMNADDDPFRKAQKRMGDALHRQKLDAQRRRGRPPTPEEEAADRLRYSIS